MVSQYLSCEYEFSGRKFGVNVFKLKDDNLTIEVYDILTNEEWRNSFDSQYIEDLTQKTGNFKHFETFLSMIESALLRKSESLAIELLSYDDLQNIKKIKEKSVNPIKSLRSCHNNKRYLILSYTTDFDQTHYPIPLNYFGCPSTEYFRKSISELRAALCNTTISKPSESLQQATTIELEKARSTISRLQSENEALMQELAQLRNLRRISDYDQLGCDKELQFSLKTVVDKLESELFEARSKLSHQTDRYRHDLAQLRSELQTSTASHHGLRRRVQQLTDELNLFRRRSNNRSISPNVHHETRCSRPLSVNSGTERCSRRDFTSAISRNEIKRQTNYNNPVLSHLCNFQRRAGSADSILHRAAVRTSLASPDHSTRHNFKTQARNFNKTMSRERASSVDRAFTSSKPPIRRFNPTAYVQEKQKQREETMVKRLSRQRALQSSARSSSSLDSRCGSTRRHSISPESSSLFTRVSRASPLLSSTESLINQTKPKFRGRNSLSRRPQYSLSSGDSDMDQPSFCSPRPISTKIRSSQAIVRRNPRSLQTNTKQYGRPNKLNTSGDRKRSNTPLNDIVQSGNIKSNLARDRLCHPSDNELDSDYSSHSNHRSRQHYTKSSRTMTSNSPRKTLSDPDTEIDEIDRRLNVLQDFFQKYLTTS